MSPTSQRSAPVAGSAGRWLARSRPPQPTDECGLVRCEPGWSWQVRLTDFDLWLVVDGRGWAEIDGRRTELGRGDLLHLTPGVTVRAEQDPDHRFTIAYCHYDWPDGSPPAELGRSAAVRLSAPVPIEEHLTAVIRTAGSPSALTGAARSAHLLLALIEVWRQRVAGAGSPATDPRIDRVITTLRTDPGRRVGLDEAARWAQMSPQYFSRTFTAQVGRSFRDFQLGNRLDRARTLLRESTMTVGQVARALGYPDTFLFSRQMSHRFGRSPTGLRASGRTVTPRGPAGTTAERGDVLEVADGTKEQP